MTSNTNLLSEGYHGFQASERLRRVESRERIMAYSADPTGVVTAGATTLLVDYTNWDLYVNDTGAPGIGTSWQLVGGGGGAIPHNLLNGVVHPDTVNSAPVADAMIYADGTPEWDRTTHIQWSETNDVLTLTPQAAGGITFAGATTFNRIRMPDNIANGLFIDDDNSAAAGSPTYMLFASTDGSQLITLGTEVTDPDPTGGALSERWGNGAIASGAEATALGNISQATGDETIAFGYDARATGDQACALGDATRASQDRAIAIGYSADATASGSTIALGYTALANASSCVAIGGLVLGRSSSSVIIGTSSQSPSSTNSNTVVGHSARVTSGSGGTAIGANSRSTQTGIAIGSSAIVSAGNTGMAIGNAASCSGIGSIALGASNVVTHQDCILVGNSITSGQTNTIILGDEGTVEYRVGIGTTTPDTQLHIYEDSALTNTVLDMLRLEHATSGTPAAGFGIGFEWELESTTTNRIAATDETLWQTATDASRSAIRRFEVLSNTNDWEFLRLSGHNTQAESVFNEPQEDIDFRIESDAETHAYFMQASNGYSGFGESTPDMRIHSTETKTLSGNVNDDYSASLNFQPGYTGAFTVTRHNYINMDDVSLAGGAAVTDSAAIRFDDGFGSHKALAASFNTTDSNGDTTAWAGGVIINVNGTLFKLAAIAV